MANKGNSDTHTAYNHHEDGVAEKNTLQQPEAIEATFDALGGAPNPWGRGHLQLYGACLIIYLCSTMNGISILASNDQIYLLVLTGHQRLLWFAHGLHQRYSRVSRVL